MEFKSITNWQAQLNLMWLGQIILIAMLAMSLPYWPLYIAQLGDFNPQQIRFWSAAIYIAPFVSSTFSSPIWGKLGDKYGYKPMVIRACVGLFITQLLILLASNVELIFIIRVLQGILAGFVVAAQSWAIAITPDHERGATMGKLQSATAVGNLLGPLLGGVIAAYSGYQSIFSSSVIICGAITLIFLFFLQNTAPANSTHLTSESCSTYRMVADLHRPVLSILFVIIVIQLARAMITPVFALFVTEQLRGTEITIGLLYAATGLMIFMTAPSWGRLLDKYIQHENLAFNLIVTLLFISAGLQVLHAYATSPNTIFILRLLWGICLGGLLPILLRLLVDRANQHQHGFFLGLGNSATKLGNLLGIIIGALIEFSFGYANTFLTTAILYTITGMIILSNLTSIKKLTHE